MGSLKRLQEEQMEREIAERENIHAKLGDGCEVCGGEMDWEDCEAYLHALEREDLI